MSLQSKRPSITRFLSSGAHDMRFNYFDPNKISALSKNHSPRNIEFEKYTKRKDLWEGSTSNIPHVPSIDDRKAMSQSIKLGKSFKNDLVRNL